MCHESAALKWMVVGAIALVMLTAGAVWRVQDWRYGKALAELVGLHKDDLTAFSNAAAAEARHQQDKRLVLEQRLSTSDKTNHEKLTNAERYQARLRDSLATTELRLSVLLDATDAANRCPMQYGAAAGGVDHGGARAELDPVHAQRIVAITNDGDQGLIALRACQDYVKEINTDHRD